MNYRDRWIVSAEVDLDMPEFKNIWVLSYDHIEWDGGGVSSIRNDEDVTWLEEQREG
jgi:hypothetical protein